jgi:hypothetical protein
MFEWASPSGGRPLMGNLKIGARPAAGVGGMAVKPAGG